MAALLTITLLLLCCSVSASQGDCDYNVATGDDFTVPLDQGLEGFRRIQWMHNSSYVFNGRISKGSITVIFLNVTDTFPNGSLKLTKVNKSTAGTYIPEIYDSNGKKILLKKKSLCVLDRVTKPSVKVQCGRKPKESQVTFTCLSNQKDLHIEWLKNKEVIKTKAATLTEDGEKVERDSFSCKVSNAVSFMVSEPVTQTCFKSQFGFVYIKVMGVQIWIIIASGGGVVLLLILTIIICCIMNKRRKRLNLKDEEELRLDWTNSEQQQQQHHHNHKHHHHNPPPGHPQHQHQQQHQSAGHTGPRQNRSRQQREQRPRLPEPPGSHPQPSPRRAAQGPGPAVNHDDEQPPPLPQPRKKAPL